jgi:hypothetical protein
MFFLGVFLGVYKGGKQSTLCIRDFEISIFLKIEAIPTHK